MAVSNISNRLIQFYKAEFLNKTYIKLYGPYWSLLSYQPYMSNIKHTLSSEYKLPYAVHQIL